LAPIFEPPTYPGGREFESLIAHTDYQAVMTKCCNCFFAWCNNGATLYGLIWPHETDEL